MTICRKSHANGSVSFTFKFFLGHPKKKSGKGGGGEQIFILKYVQTHFLAPKTSDLFFFTSLSYLFLKLTVS